MFLILFSIVQNKIKNLKISVSFFQCQKRNKIFRTPNGHSFFYIEAQNFENCTHAVIRFLQRYTELWKLYPNGHYYFPQGNAKSNYLSSMHVPKRSFVRLQRNTKFYSCIQTAIRFLQRNTKFYSCS